MQQANPLSRKALAAVFEAHWLRASNHCVIYPRRKTVRFENHGLSP